MAVDSLGIKGILPLSMLDWEGHLVTTLFMGSCNLRCPFCHNATLVLDNDKMSDISEVARATLVSKQGWVDAICITGGEPTLNASLFDLIDSIRSMGYKIKLDTNGTRPEILKRIIDGRLIDAVAMDIKTGFSKYPLATNITRDYSEEVRESARMIVEAQADTNSDAGEQPKRLQVEFRTTVVPTFVDRSDIVEIAEFIGALGARKYYLQQFNPKSVMSPEAGSIKPYSRDELQKMVGDASQFVPTSLRGAE